MSTPRSSKTQASPARQAALKVLLDWGRDRGYAADLIAQTGRGLALSPPDEAFLRDLVLTVLRNLTRLDGWIGTLTQNRHLDDRTAWLLRLGLAQLLLLDVAQHAAVNETVGQAWKSGGLVNAVLRRACREADSLQAEAARLEPADRLSHPDFLFERWTRDFGTEEATAICEWNQRPAEVYLRANGLKPESTEVLANADGTEPVGEGFFRCTTLPLEELRRGIAYAQDPSTAIAPRLLQPKRGDQVLDACAAPGGKTAILAEIMGSSGRIVAADGSKRRLPRMRENLERLGVTIAEEVRHRWGMDPLPDDWLEAFDGILADVPCSNTGVMRRRVDVRWRLQPKDFAELAQQQLAIVTALIPCLKPGGVLVYSTCSIDREENEAVVEDLIRQVPGLVLEETRLILPHKDGVDGAFAARIRKETEAG